MKRQILALLLLAGLAVVSCTSEKQNVITGKIEGLQVGDKVVLLTTDDNPVPIDTAVVEKEGEFILKTAVAGAYVSLRHKDKDVHIFLEGYAAVQLTGSVDQWYYVHATGGIYDHPDMQEILRVTDSAKLIQQKALMLLSEAREANDTAKLAQGSNLIGESNAILRLIDPMENEFREKHPELAYSAFLLMYNYELMEDFDKYEEAFNALTPEAQSSPSGSRIRAYISSTKASMVGAVAPEFSLKALDGETVALSSYQGRYVLLDFWGSWCGVCRMSAPKLVKLYEELKDQGAEIEFIGIACDDRDDSKWKKAVEEDGFTWTQLNDSHMPAGKSIGGDYAIRSFPTCVLVSPEGVILYRESPTAKEFIPKIKELLGVS